MRHSQPELDKRCALLSLMFVIARDTNQLCNRMFAFAHIIACAAEHGVTVINVAFEKYAAYFETTSQDLLCRYPPRASPWPRDQATRERLNRIVTRIVHSLQAGRLRTLRGRRIQVLQSSYVSTLENPNGDYRLDQPEFLRQLPRHQLIFFDGPLFRDRENFSKYAENLRAYFAPLPCYGERVEGLMRSTRESAEVIVGVHIRQRDYRQFRQGRHYHTAPEFVPLMRAIQAQLTGQRVAFLICSDEPQHGGDFARMNVHFGTGHAIEDLYALARCDYLIGPPSTFSAWASFYGKVPLYFIEDVRYCPYLTEFTPNNG